MFRGWEKTDLFLVTTYARNRIEKFFVFWLSYTDDPPDCKLYDIKIAQIIEVQLYLLKALTVEFRRQCQRKFDAAILNVATNKNSRVFSVFTCLFKHLF